MHIYIYVHIYIYSDLIHSPGYDWPGRLSGVFMFFLK